jgi:3-phenylpropionate/trans-cinnamate dioxygenase ferredoxin component
LVRVCAAADLAPGEIRAVPGHPIVVCRASASAGPGDVYAFGSACTHMRAALRAGTVVDGCLQCPLHGARFKLSTGAVRRGPARRGLPVYPVVISDGEVYVDPRPRAQGRRRRWPW